MKRSEMTCEKCAYSEHPPSMLATEGDGRLLCYALPPCLDNDKAWVAPSEHCRALGRWAHSPPGRTGTVYLRWEDGEP